jgi:hypothetical protein
MMEPNAEEFLQHVGPGSDLKVRLLIDPAPSYSAP